MKIFQTCEEEYVTKSLCTIQLKAFDHYDHCIASIRMPWIRKVYEINDIDKMQSST